MMRCRRIRWKFPVTFMDANLLYRVMRFMGAEGTRTEYNVTLLCYPGEQ